MSDKTPYSAASRETLPVTALLQAVVEVNWHRNGAQKLGWEISLATNDEGDLTVSVFRDACWPSLSSELDAEDENA